MNLMDKIKDTASIGLAFGWTGIKKLPSAAWWALTKSPKLFRRGFQAAAVYFGSVAAEKILDKVHENFPDNEIVAKADTVVHAAVNAENFLLGGAASLAKSAYESVPAKASSVREPAQARADNDTLKPPPLEPVTDETKLESESIKQAQLALPAVSFGNLPPTAPQTSLPMAGDAQPREAAFMPVEATERNRANLNTTIAMPVPAAPAPAQAVTCAASVLGPDGLPIDGGYDPKTGITWGPYMKPYSGPHPQIKTQFKP